MQKAKNPETPFRVGIIPEALGGQDAKAHTVFVSGKKMFWSETDKEYVIYNSKGKEVLSVKKGTSTNLVAGAALRPGLTETERNACHLAIYLLGEKNE
jgi:uncharacterized protein YjlB